MHAHILGICGTFMAGVARLAKALGWRITGCDSHVYPPMSEQLRDDGITVIEGYDPRQLHPAPDCVIIGNALSRGNEAVEHVLASGLPYTSGPGFLARYVLPRYRVLAVAGTHGKTTTSSILAWLLDAAGLDPGFLIGGIAHNFGVSARLGGGAFFVVEADEYDTAFFDKRAKFVHYTPHTLILNNLEYDHADIYPDIEAIQWQFHQLLRIVPGNSLIIAPREDRHLQQVLQRGCWTPVEYVTETRSPDAWHARDISPDGRSFTVAFGDRDFGRIGWESSGRHNIHNALAAIAAARHAGVAPQTSLEALSRFAGIKRRLEVIGAGEGITLYDDFAHHPTAIRATLQGLRATVQNDARIIVILEPRSNTMRLGVHRQTLAPSLSGADAVILYQAPDLPWPCQAIADALAGPARVFDTIDAIVAYIRESARRGDHIVIMSNGGFGGIHGRLKEALFSA